MCGFITRQMLRGEAMDGRFQARKAEDGLVIGELRGDERAQGGVRGERRVTILMETETGTGQGEEGRQAGREGGWVGNWETCLEVSLEPFSLSSAATVPTARQI